MALAALCPGEGLGGFGGLCVACAPLEQDATQHPLGFRAETCGTQGDALARWGDWREPTGVGIAHVAGSYELASAGDSA